MRFVFYNTLTRKKEELKPLKKDKLDVFVCGPTVYDLSHIGHGRIYVVFDSIVKTLKKNGLRVRYLQNITDVDDKIIDRARLTNKTPKALAREFEKEYLKDMKALKIDSVDIYARASDHIAEIISQIERLLEKGFAYIASSGIYFEVNKFNDYGKLSGQKLEDKFNTERVEHDPEKKNQKDFALWKRSSFDKAQDKKSEPSWPSPWGMGRPGWHIEDTAIAEKYFGQQYDMHGGALDLIFPHHECEIAQIEAISNKKPYVNMWLHGGFLTVRGEKMSKSIGNIIVLRDLLKNYSAESFRLMILQAHYRSPIDYDEDLIKQAEATSERLAEFYERVKQNKRNSSENNHLAEKIKNARENFWRAVGNDFDTPVAFAILFSFVKDINPLLDNSSLSKRETKSVINLLEKINEVFGIIKKRTKQTAPREIKDLAKERELFRKEKRWAEADQTRKQLSELGWVVEDTPQGPKLKRII